jgi:hypothetical protein
MLKKLTAKTSDVGSCKMGVSISVLEVPFLISRVQSVSESLSVEVAEFPK